MKLKPIISALVLLSFSANCLTQEKSDSLPHTKSEMTHQEAVSIQEQTSKKLGLPIEFSVVINEKIWVEFSLIPPGVFYMGSRKTKQELSSKYGEHPGYFDLEYPKHRVTLTKPFYIGKFEVTQEQWSAVMNRNPSHETGDNFPVEYTTWLECAEFCEKLRILSGQEIRLPTEAEWEYACRAGTNTEFNFGDEFNPEFANGNLGHLVPVGSYKPNAWGLYDMHGNVKEWVQDDYYQYTTESQIDPIAPAYYGKMIRGGGHEGTVESCRSARRHAHLKSVADQGAGFRLAITIEH